VTQVIVAAGLVVLAVILSRVGRLGLQRELAVAALRAAVQLAAVGALIALVFEHTGLAAAFVALMLATATFTSARRLQGVPEAPLRAGAAIAAGAATGLGPLLATGAFDTTPRELVPVAGILTGGAMVAASVTGGRLVEQVADDLALIEARLTLGVPAREALAPAVRRAAVTGLIPAVDQTKNVGLVALPGTFVGLVLGGASPAEAARVQLVILLSLLAVEVAAALAAARLVVAGLTAPGERVVPPRATRPGWYRSAGSRLRSRPPP
jgi:putative ABC transport system permease protein